MEDTESKENRRRWTAEGKLRMLEEAGPGGAPAAEVCCKHGISSRQFCDWRRQACEGALQALSPRPSGRRTNGLEQRHLAELARLRAVIAEVAAEDLELWHLESREILRRALLDLAAQGPAGAAASGAREDEAGGPPQPR